MARILIIDDDPDIVAGMRVVLESKGHEISFVHSGDEGIGEAKAQKPDLVILDVMMETNSKGFEVARALKSDEICKNIPILMLTAIKEKMGLDFNKEAGDEAWLPVNDYCAKPLNPEELLTKVENLLNP